ncbi:hypothetical protein C731_4546 [Mycolicibacterium hassiacum DSM 44199]|uniref:Uncharacterized protein n=1 Tax=Mycolicibacterium hassiacum (strain DSM 44199 / CIP 105218 / JCM 12690 / 3849) TaxID=1122247 RepID=K5BCF4_MYCHD|nr:hypothetical protein C731_4546 [Mycolicibacterium hassiacum DSM 44199]
MATAWDGAGASPSRRADRVQGRSRSMCITCDDNSEQMFGQLRKGRCRR